MEAVVSLLFTIAAVIFIFFMAWFISRLVASRGSAGISGQGRHIQVVEKITVSKDCQLMLVKSFDKLLLVGMTAQGMTTLREFSAERIDIEMPPSKMESFAQTFKTTLDSALPDGVVRNTVDKLFRSKERPDGQG